MLTSLDFLSQGKTFPPFEERERLNKYNDSWKLYEGKHSQVFSRWSRTAGVDDLNVVVNWNRRLSVLWADMLFGQAPEITSNNQTALNRVIYSNDLYEKLYESAIDTSRYGTGLLKVRVENGNAIIEAVPANIWFPVVSPDNLKDVQAHVLAWTWKESDTLDANQFLSAEIHEKGRVTYRTYSLASDRGISVLLNEEVEETGVDKFLVRPINNITTSDKLVGSNDYDDINPLLEEIEMRLTQISRVLDIHADPKMYGDETALEYNHRTGEYVVRGGGDFFPLSEDGQVPGYITWDGLLEDAQNQINTLMKQFYVLTQTSPAAFGQLEGGLVESGSALRRLLMASIIKVNRMKVRYHTALMDILDTASQLQAKNGGQSFSEGLMVEFRDALPEDAMEVTQIEQMRYSSGLTSLESSLGRLDGIDGDDVQQEIERIRIDRESKTDE